ncbi:uncharacterized protein CDV56_108775 [Aspergillus thermomutatus]|uniref:WD-like domain-containing protein n=1 Tax=Aspergillus thermomutatus TaxID=41047 RepID=A0A397HTP5_ASPTH|nr:uncharacterized protein CDV56_108775 [Aspergillus thermomutatus]RHZ64946.1 hypothetical protein CDV56_108775 [Aspergillus thermomutatus]
MSLNYTEPVEQLFLDLPLQDVINDTAGMPVTEPWASEYVDAIRDGRFGDAIWARYHIAGDMQNGIIEGTNITVLESIEEDAVGYRLDAPEAYAEALSLYANTSSADGHTDVIEIITRIGHEDIAELETRTTYSIRCSTNYLAYASSCVSLLENMSKQKIAISRTRAVASYGNCRMRVVPYGSGADLTYYTAHAVGRLIEEECSYVPACCSYLTVSGYSPKNSGHRKVCLSSKNTGCHS